MRRPSKSRFDSGETVNPSVPGSEFVMEGRWPAFASTAPLTTRRRRQKKVRANRYDVHLYPIIVPASARAVLAGPPRCAAPRQLRRFREPVPHVFRNSPQTPPLLHPQPASRRPGRPSVCRRRPRGPGGRPNRMGAPAAPRLRTPQTGSHRQRDSRVRNRSAATRCSRHFTRPGISRSRRLPSARPWSMEETP